MKDESNRPAPDPGAILSLVQRCGQGEPEAIADFFRAYSADIYNFPIRVFHLDEDSASDFYLYALEHLRGGNRFKSFQGKSTFRTWFYSVLRNLVIDWLRLTRFRRQDSTLLPDQIAAQPPRENDPLVHSWLGMLPVESRTLVKLTFLYYLEMGSEELAHIIARSGLTEAQVTGRLAALKDTLSERELTNLANEDKITSLYVAILDLRAKRERILGAGGWPDRSFEVEKLDRAIEKKLTQRARLLGRKEKGHFVVRMPYREIAALMAMPEGSVSVTVMRAFEKLKELKKIEPGYNAMHINSVKEYET